MASGVSMELTRAQAEAQSGLKLRNRQVVVRSDWFGKDWAENVFGTAWRRKFFTGTIKLYDEKENRWDVDFNYEGFAAVGMTTNAVKEYLIGTWPLTERGRGHVVEHVDAGSGGAEEAVVELSDDEDDNNTFPADDGGPILSEGDFVTAGSVKWRKLKVQSTCEWEKQGGTKTRTKVHWKRFAHRSTHDSKALKYILAFFGTHEYLLYWVRLIDEEGRRRYGKREWLTNHRSLRLGYFLRFLGCWVYIQMNPGLDIREYFGERRNQKKPKHASTSSTPPLTTTPKHDLSEYMKITDFERIRTCFLVPTYDATGLDADGVINNDPSAAKPCKQPTNQTGTPRNINSDPFARVRRWYDHFNKHWSDCVTPSWLLVIDEAVIPWDGEDMPGWIIIDRKPRGKGRELRIICDALTRIVLRVDVMEGAKERFGRLEHKKEYLDQYGASVATQLRLTKPWHGSGRCLIADSWFGSVEAVVALRDVGLFAIEQVKQVHKGFPSAWLKSQLESTSRGDHIVLQTTVKEYPIMALAHNGPGGKPHLLVCTFSTSLPANKYTYMKRLLKGAWTTHFERAIKQPAGTSLYRLFWNIVDYVNKMRVNGGKGRQGVGLFDVWSTRQWHIRDIVGLLGTVISCQANLAARWEDGFDGDLREWHDMCFHELIHNPFYMAEESEVTAISSGTPEPSRRTTRLSTAGAGGTSQTTPEKAKKKVECCLGSIGVKTNTSAKTNKTYNKAIQKNCTVCGGLTTYQCDTCASKGMKAWVCASSKRAACFTSHCNKVIETGRVHTPKRKRKQN